MNNNNYESKYKTLFITLFIKRSIHVYISQLVHTFYNVSVAKIVTPLGLKHIYSTLNPQLNFFSPQAVKIYPEETHFRTQSTDTTTTIFNKVEKKKNISTNNKV